jgi:hypothetical protein
VEHQILDVILSDAESAAADEGESKNLRLLIHFFGATENSLTSEMLQEQAR